MFGRGEVRRTERALDALRDLSSPRAVVWRDGALAGRVLIVEDNEVNRMIAREMLLVHVVDRVGERLCHACRTHRRS